MLGAVVEDLLALPIAQVVEVLDADDRDRLPGLLYFLHGDFRQADVPDLAGFLKFLQGAQGLGDRHLGIDAMQLVEIDAVELQAPQTQFDALAEIFRTADRSPLVRPGPGEPALGGDHQPLG